MHERRRLARKNLMSYSQVFDQHGGTLIGYLADLTPSGVMVIGENPMEAGKDITLQLEVPELSDIPPARMVLPARVIWCQTDVSPNFQNIGFEFKGVTGEQEKVIQAMIDGYEFHHELPVYPLRAASARP